MSVVNLQVDFWDLISTFYCPPRNVFALNTEKYRPGCIFLVTMDNECE